MHSVAKMPADERRIIFRNTAQKMGINEAIIEKDFWVCLTLDYLFHRCKWQSAFAFKGGTSLSKCYGVINRFSEDIDLILDWRVLGYAENEPLMDRSGTKQDIFNKDANYRTGIFLQEKLLPVIKTDISDIIDTDAVLYIEESDPNTINFDYPHIFSTESILQTIRLEIGALAAWTPAIKKAVTPYSAEYYPMAFKQRQSIILTSAAERIFWEKVTILHHEANRPENLLMPKRYSRHYYDLYCIAHSDNKQAAYDHPELLEKVVAFKTKFYPRKWARYDLAKPGTIKLLPPDYRLDNLREDYADMSEMMFGDYPNFNDLISSIGKLQDEINQL